MFGCMHFPPFTHMGSQIPSGKRMKQPSNSNTFAISCVCFTCAWQIHSVASYFFGISYRCILHDRHTHYFSCSGRHSYREGDRQLKEHMAVICEYYISDYYILHIASCACYLWGHKAEKCAIKIKDHNCKSLKPSFLNHKIQCSQL